MGGSALQSGGKIGEYELVRLLGKGGMGDVWLANEVPTDRRVAMKFIKPHLLDEPTFLTRFLNEAKTLGRLEHDRIVRLHRVLQCDGHLALILGFIDGKPLSDVIEERAPLPSDFVLACSRDVLPALALAHQRGIVHRDIKPQNILLDNEGRSFVSDFGIAVAEFAERGTATGFSIGTPHYMSPEQIQSPQKLAANQGGHRSDIYSYGVVMFEMLTGRLPFGERDKPEESFRVQTMHCVTPPPKPREFNPGIAPAVEAVVLLCLEKDPDHRPQSCKELLEMLEKAVISGVPPRSAAAAVPGGRVAATVFEAAPVIPGAGSGGTMVMPMPTPPGSGPTPPPVLPRPATVSKQGGVPKTAWMGMGALLMVSGIGYAIFTQSKAVDSPAKPPEKPPAVTPGPTTPGNGGGGGQRPTNPGRLPAGETPPPPQPGPTGGGGGGGVGATTPAPVPPYQPVTQSASAAPVAGEADQLLNAGKPCEAQPRAERAAELDPRYRPLLERAVNTCTNQKMADADAARADALFRSGDYCGAQGKMALAKNRYPSGQYAQRYTELEKACSDSLK